MADSKIRKQLIQKYKVDISQNKLLVLHT